MLNLKQTGMARRLQQCRIVKAIGMTWSEDDTVGQQVYGIHLTSFKNATRIYEKKC